MSRRDETKKRFRRKPVPEADRIVGNNVKALRLGASITQAAMAEKLGMTFHQVSRIERGIASAQPSTLAAMAKILRCQVGAFFLGIAP